MYSYGDFMITIDLDIMKQVFLFFWGGGAGGGEFV